MGPFLYDGGCQPASTHRRLARTRCSLFIRSATTVARPVGDIPSIKRPPSLHRKCSSHICRRGSKRATFSPQTGSVAVVWAPLNPLQKGHASHRLSGEESPPAAIGMMCSTCIGMAVKLCGVRQYPQWCPASALTRLRTACGMYGRATSRIRLHGDAIPTACKQ